MLDGRLIHTEIDVDAAGHRKLVRPRAGLLLGDHAIGDELRGLELDPKRAIEARWFPTWRASLPAGRVVRAVAAPTAVRDAA